MQIKTLTNHQKIQFFHQTTPLQQTKKKRKQTN